MVDILPALADVLRSADGQLAWGMPEQWIQAELFAALTRSLAPTDTWEVVRTELPYFTVSPVVTPSGTMAKDVESREPGGHKWIDLCVRSKAGDAYVWIDLKVRSAAFGQDPMAQRASALAAYKHDLGALAGMDVPCTARMWRSPPPAIKAYWTKEFIEAHADRLEAARQRYVAVFVQIEGGVAGQHGWGKDEIGGAAKAWARERRKTLKGNVDRLWPKMDVTVHPGFGGTKHDVVVAEWDA